MTNETHDPLGDILDALDGRPPESVRTRRKPSAEALDTILRVLRLGHNVATACRAAAVSTSTLYYVRSHDPAFARAFDTARATGIEARAERRFRSVA